VLSAINGVVPIDMPIHMKVKIKKYKVKDLSKAKNPQYFFLLPLYSANHFFMIESLLSKKSEE